MSFESSVLYQTMRDYVQAAIRLVAEVCQEGPPNVFRGLDEWRRDPDGIFRLHDREEPFWVQCIQASEDRLHSLDEYRKLVDVLRGIPPIAQQLENLVGTALGAQRIEIQHVSDHLVWRLPRRIGRLSFDETEFNRLFGEFEADLQRTSFSSVLLAPLLGFKSERVPIRLGSQIEIDSMTDNEIGRCLALGMLPNPFGLRRMADVGSPVGLRVWLDLEKITGQDKPDSRQVEAAFQVERESIERARMLLHALRVFKDGRVSVPGFLRFSTHWPLEGATSFQYSYPGPMPWFNKYEFAQSEVDEFCVFWPRLDRMTTGGSLPNAVRRFSYASDRDRDDDKLVDLMIAAESLFLSDIGSPQDRGELRYRLALRAAFFIESPEYSKRQVFKHMRRAYDARSAIVHGGGEPGAELLKSPMDAPISLRDFASVTEGLLRAGLEKRIDMVEASGTTPIDWEALIMPT